MIASAKLGRPSPGVCRLNAPLAGAEHIRTAWVFTFTAPGVFDRTMLFDIRRMRWDDELLRLSAEMINVDAEPVDEPMD